MESPNLLGHMNHKKQKRSLKMEPRTCKRMAYVFYDLLVKAAQNKIHPWQLYREKEAVAAHVSCAYQDKFFGKGHISQG